MRGLQPIQYLANLRPRFLACKLRNAFYQKRQHANPDMRLNPSRQPVIHGAHFDLGSFQGAKASFNDHQSLITTGGILKTDSIVIGFQYPFAVIFLSFSDLILIDVNLAQYQGKTDVCQRGMAVIGKMNAGNCQHHRYPRTSRYKNMGAPRKEVITPTGSAPDPTRTRPILSAESSSRAP